MSRCSHDQQRPAKYLNGWLFCPTCGRFKKETDQ